MLRRGCVLGIGAALGVLLVGLVGLVALGVLAGARRPAPVTLTCTDQIRVVIYARSDDDGRRATGTIRNTCTRDLEVEYTLTGLNDFNRVVTGPVRQTAFVRANEAIPISYALYPDGPRGSMVIVHAAVVSLTPY